MQSKQERERAFHNAAFSDGRRAVVVPAYAVMHGSRICYETHVRAHARGARMLELGCGETAMSSVLGKEAAAIVGIDLSEVAVAKARQRARERGLRAHYSVMDAEALALPDASFDLICSVAILHHLDLDRAYSEIARTLRPTGSAVFIEPLGHNPAINLYRHLTPRLRTPDEHPLRLGDLALARRYFQDVDVRYFALCSLAAMPFKGWKRFALVLNTLERADELLFRRLPFMRRYAWQVVMVMGRPIRESSVPALSAAAALQVT